MTVDEAMKLASAYREAQSAGLGAAACICLRDEVLRLREDKEAQQLRINGMEARIEEQDVGGADILRRLERCHDDADKYQLRVEALHKAFIDGPGNSDGEGPSLDAIEQFFDALGEVLRGDSESGR